MFSKYAHHAYPDGDDDYFDEIDYTPRPPPKCRQCSTTGYWVQENGKWQLNEGGKRHVCPPVQDNLEGFD